MFLVEIRDFHGSNIIGYFPVPTWSGFAGFICLAQDEFFFCGDSDEFASPQLTISQSSGREPEGLPRKEQFVFEGYQGR